MPGKCFVSDHTTFNHAKPTGVLVHTLLFTNTVVWWLVLADFKARYTKTVHRLFNAHLSDCITKNNAHYLLSGGV